MYGVIFADAGATSSALTRQLRRDSPNDCSWISVYSLRWVLTVKQLRCWIDHPLYVNKILSNGHLQEAMNFQNFSN
jgi:hypothetical protein